MSHVIKARRSKQIGNLGKEKSDKLHDKYIRKIDYDNRKPNMTGWRQNETKK